MKTTEFTHYLQTEKQFSESTIHAHLYNLQKVNDWLKETNRTELNHLSYTEILEFIKSQQSTSISVATLNLRLNSLKQYYEYLKHIGIIEKNPAKKLHIKGAVKSITQNVFSYSELEQLYNDYLNLPALTKAKPISPFLKMRNNVLAGFLLWQGMVSGEIEKLQLNHVNLDEGILKVPAIRRSASRELKLLPVQILQLYKYIYEARPKLLMIRENSKANLGSAPDRFISGNVHNLVHHLLQTFKGLNQKVNSLPQLRASIIIHWIKVHGKRQAQYMAGHKYISSTEHFEMQELDSLTDTLLQHHPFS